jgi:hypothetical protein
MVWLGLTALAPFALGPDACERFGLPASDVDLPAAIVLYALAIIALFNLASHVRADIYLRRAHGPDLFLERWKDGDALMAKIASGALTVDNELGAASKSAEGYEKRVAKELKLVSDTAREQIEDLRNPSSAFGRAETRMGLRKFHDDISRSDRGFYRTLDAGPLIGLFLAAALTFTLQVLEFENAPIFCPAQANVPPSQ